ncbi:ABC transporter ATP-binding protein [Halopseudomonas phragmitis]|uniref:ABC transporter domain-containing protein n=1 Tax=Halopseudomonas phragmitis TaxID=1931241 RepID=A0A1V0B659_9GAMM|nr:ABC transporter ATP-binding protein [Halopseudomonas phragmitis]AQZ95274.1 hypothetical protein BVH74_11150 [Halopseudomonas phragmitis]
MEQPVISIRDVSKFYKLYKVSRDRLKEALHPFGKKYHEDFYAIRGLSLDVRKGEILGIVGRNGCGKSTLLKLISRVLTPNSGEIRVHGKVTALLELGAGFNPEFTGRENIRFYSTILGLSAKEIDALTPVIIEFAELGEFIDQPVKTYSSGMKSRLGFAVAVHVEPDILILDEVLAVGDAVFKRKCFAKMEEFFNAGKTVLFVSHDASAVNKLCNRAVLIHDGGIILDSVPKEVTKFYEKLIFAKEKDRAAILSEIKAFNAQEAPSIDERVSENSEALLESSAAIATAEKLEAYYVKGLVPKSTVNYASDRAEIIDPHFTTLSGKRVNVLVSGEEYLYVYSVRFKDAARNISLGMQIKDVHGLPITAASLHYDVNGLIESIPAGKNIRVQWRFLCSLLAGHFYTNAGVAEIVGGEPVFLTRMVDAAVIKVIVDNKRIARGIVDMGQAPEWEML